MLDASDEKKELTKKVEKLRKEQKKTKKISKQNSRKTWILITIIGVAIIGFLYYDSSTETQQARTGGFIIENLRGDTVDIWVAWIIPENSTLNVNIKNNELLSDEQLSIARDVFASKESTEIDNSILHKGPPNTYSTFYLGWSGALEDASIHQTKYYIPTDFNFVDESDIAGDIMVEFTKSYSGDGHSGFTKIIADDAKNQILKATITIYAVDTLSNEQLEAILRHEIGHAMGLAHSTAPEDLMHPTLPEQYPLISECDIDAIVALYADKKTNQVVCES